MKNVTIAEKTIADCNGIAKSMELNKAGISNKEIRQLTEDGRIKKLQNGYYYVGNYPSEEGIIKKLMPSAIVSMESALFHYGYSDWTPREWTLAVPRDYSRSRLLTSAVNVKPYFVQNETFEIGVTLQKVNGTELRMYDRERCICDCFRYRTKMDTEMFAKAINAYMKDPNKRISVLYEYAKRLKITEKVNEVIEVLVNGSPSFY